MGNIVILRIQQFCSQRLHHPGTAIIGGTSANSNDDMLNASVQRMTD